MYMLNKVKYKLFMMKFKQHQRLCVVQGRERSHEDQPSADGSGVFRDRDLEKHITPQTLKPNVKQNPLYAHISIINNTEENNKSKPSWTIQEYDRHTAHGQLGDYMKVLHINIHTPY